MKKMILVDQRVYNNLLKFVFKANKKLDYLMEMPEYNKDWLTIKEVETQFSLSRKMLEGYKKQGLKFSQKKPNGKILIRKSDLEKFITKK
jgi:hypothetical protein